MSTEPAPGPGGEHEPGLKGVEAAMGSLSPAPGRLDRDRVMYLAGRASARPAPLARAGWPALAAGLAALALAEGFALSGRPGARVVERVVYVPAPPPAPAPEKAPAVVPGPQDEGGPAPERRLADGRAPGRLPFLALSRAETDYQRLRTRLLRDGADALPEPPAWRPGGVGTAPGPIEPASSLLRSEVDAILNPGDPS